jgi:hypothetical protein
MTLGRGLPKAPAWRTAERPNSHQLTMSCGKLAGGHEPLLGRVLARNGLRQPADFASRGEAKR